MIYIYMYTSTYYPVILFFSTSNFEEQFQHHQAIEALLGPRRPGEAQVESARSRVKACFLLWKLEVLRWNFPKFPLGSQETHIFFQHFSTKESLEYIIMKQMIFWWRCWRGQQVSQNVSNPAGCWRSGGQDANSRRIWGATVPWVSSETPWKTMDLWISTWIWWHSLFILFIHLPLQRWSYTWCFFCWR